MSARVLLGCIAFLALAALESRRAVVAQGVFDTVHVDVKIDCLSGRGVGFSLTPWSITVREGDSLNWRLDAGSGVTEMEVIPKTGRPWPFRARPPYRSGKGQSVGARALEPGPSGRSRYQYAVSGICVRDANTSDTVIIDPDMIIIRR